MNNIIITDEDILELELDFGNELQFNECRQTVLKSYEDVQACAGSGKTTLVAAKLVLLAKKWTEKYKGICVITHTNIAKNEILRRLQEHPSGHKILYYPHFIGTIQEFVNRFLGIPYCKSEGWSIKNVDDIRCVQVFERLLQPGTKSFLLKKPNASLDNFKYEFCENKLELNIPGFNDTSSSNSYNDLVQVKKHLIKEGLFYYSEMYAFANKLLLNNPQIIESLQTRFSFVIIDEMQDTQKYQDDLICQIFDSDNVSIQRYGDPDQAIFDGIGGSKPNDSYNNVDLVAIPESHRFGNDIAYKIRGLSYNQLNLKSIRDESDGDAPHTIFLYDDQSITLVIPAFGQLVFDYFSTSDLFMNKQYEEYVIKAVGGIGRENPSGLTIKHYWEDYDKSKSIKTFRADKLIHIIRKCSENQQGDVSYDYKLLFQGILDLMRKGNRKILNAEGKSVYFGKTSLILHLNETQNYQKLRYLLTSWIIGDFPQKDIWDQQMANLKEILGLSNQPLTQEASYFISYDETLPIKHDDKNLSTNIYRHNKTLDIEVSTIHAVKGETHDATLILETKYYSYYDIKECLDFLIDNVKARPPEDHEHPRKSTSIQANFLKRLYVAASRPRHLLCLALHNDHISVDQIADLKKIGWQIKNT